MPYVACLAVVTAGGLVATNDLLDWHMPPMSANKEV